MAKKKTDAQRVAKIKKAIYPLLKFFGVSTQYRVVVSFTNRIGEYHSGAVAQVVANFPYRNIAIEYLRSFVDGADAESLEEVTIHELLHALVFTPYRGMLGLDKVPLQVSHTEESIVDMLTVWLMRLRPKKGFILR
ncbi:hypothetical protein LCGC14_0532470 [marine sediment metagenome]|uniref:SprT-like domain-containing protein n=1 Tax=marine sediment metagenome TaxID=412755 RepID=A0A0F9V3F6_9ZZZZ